MTWKQLIVALVVIAVAVVILVGALSSCGRHGSSDRPGATSATG
jgi:hypothetical protein